MATFSSTISSFMAAIILLLGLFTANLDLTGAESVGVCYGMLGNNLPSAGEVIELYKSHNIRRMRLYDPNPAALQALRGSNIEVMLGSGTVLGANKGTAGLAQFVLPALVNVFNAIRSAGLQDQIRISTAIDMTLIGNSFPPSAGAFRGDVRSYLDPIIGHLAWARTPLLANIYTYFSYAGNPRDISLPYAIFTSPSPVIWDQGRGYQNLFDAMLDSLYSALENAGQHSVDVVVSESGWPSAGGFGTSVDNARTYLSNLIRHVQGGTPKRPGKAIETYLFAMFDENRKEPELEKHFGLFSPNKQAKYPLSFGGGRIWDVSAEYNATISLKSDM
ncbi:hypothetical protein CRYUN_Cryun10bG0009300 [Craigia yunnanensis]